MYNKADLGINNTLITNSSYKLAKHIMWNYGFIILNGGVDFLE